MSCHGFFHVRSKEFGNLLTTDCIIAINRATACPSKSQPALSFFLSFFLLRAGVEVLQDGVKGLCLYGQLTGS
jgi:hypothetical protein